jgi:hypothetical protein
MRNPSVKSGEWTAMPQDPDTRCRAEQQAVAGPGVVGPAQVADGETGQPLKVQVLARLFTIQLSGYCEWSRQIDLPQIGYIGQMPAAEEPTGVRVCAGCGYPTLGQAMCAFCQQLTVLTADRSVGEDPPAA